MGCDMYIYMCVCVYPKARVHTDQVRGEKKKQGDSLCLYFFAFDFQHPILH